MNGGNGVLGEFLSLSGMFGLALLCPYEPTCAVQVERLRKQQQAETEHQEAIQTQRMAALKLHYESCIQGDEKATHPHQEIHLSARARRLTGPVFRCVDSKRQRTASL